MRGTGRSSGAITIVNALFTGVGAAAAVSLPVEAEVALSERPRGDVGRLSIPPEAATALARETVLEGLRRYAPDRTFDASLALRSAIPAARGLKSSSAVATAILAATSRAVGRAPDPTEVARAAADVGQRVGLSATGAFDDAFVSIAGGAVVTDNPGRKVLRRLDLDPSQRVLLWIPVAAHRPSPEWAETFARHAAEGRAAADLARRGEALRALERNTELVERVMAYSEYRAMREELRRQGATGSGVSGMGPTLAVLAPAERLTRLRGVLPPGNAQVMTVELVPPQGAHP